MESKLNRPITQEEIETYQQDGVVCLRKFFDPDWIEHLRKMVDEDMKTPSPMCKNVDNDKEHGGFFFDTFLSHHLDGFDKAVRESPGAEIAGRLMQSNKVNLLFDQLLIKDPGATTRTVWHHDATYWPVAGDQISTMWLALDPVTHETGAVEYIKGSHLWGQRYLAVSFNPEEKYEENLPKVPNIEASRSDYDIIWFDLEPGDCTVHHALTVHGAPGNASQSMRRRAYVTRWTGDDVIYNPRPNLMKILYDPGIECGAPLDSKLFPVIWRSDTPI